WNFLLDLRNTFGNIEEVEGGLIERKTGRLSAWLADAGRRAVGRGAVVKLRGGRGDPLRRPHRFRLDVLRARRSGVFHLFFEAVHALLELDEGLADRPAQLRQVAPEEQNAQHQQQHDLLSSQAEHGTLLLVLSDCNSLARRLKVTSS